MKIDRRGASLIEILIAIVIIVVASIGALSYFSVGLGNVNKQGNRRAALERARERLESLSSVSLSELPGINTEFPQDAQPTFWLSCTGGPPCAWGFQQVPLREQGVVVDEFTNQEMETTAKWVDDPFANTSTPDVLELSAKVWFIPGTGRDDDNFHRVHLRTLRAP